MASALMTGRSSRDTRTYYDVKGATNDTVAPGTYANTHNNPTKVPTESSVPFYSLQERVLNPDNSTKALTPGPGSYISQKQMVTARVDGTDGPLVATSMKSQSNRMGPTSPGSSVYLPSSIELNPGPGTYDNASAWTPRIRKALRGKTKPVLEALEKSKPSIPAVRRRPGQAPESTMEAEEDLGTIRHTGDGQDKVGPGEYEPDTEQYITRNSIKQTAIGASKLKRELWEPSVAIHSSQPAKEIPGPGSYKAKQGLAEKTQDFSEEGTNTSQFMSRVAMAHQVEVKEERVVPGPGKYDLAGDIEMNMKIIRERSSGLAEQTRFGSNTERVGWSRDLNQPFTDPYHLHHVPGPGHYPGAGSSFPESPRKKNAEKAVPKPKKIHGVHHPSLIMALQDVQGPLQAFNSTDDRHCNKAILHENPPPWQYNKDTAPGQSIVATLVEKAKVGRRGVFGTCANRFYGSPLEGRQGLPDPATGLDSPTSVSKPGQNKEPRVMFQSQSPRFHEAAGPREPEAHKVGGTKNVTPAPGQYVIEKEVNYRSQFRTPRQEHLSFGSCKDRFQTEQDELFFGHHPQISNPGPGDYNARRPIRAVGAAHSKAKRPDAKVGSTSADVGPGSYGGSVDTSLVKNTFNVSAKATADVSQMSSSLVKGNVL